MLCYSVRVNFCWPNILEQFFAVFLSKEREVPSETKLQSVTVFGIESSSTRVSSAMGEKLVV